MTIPVSYPGVYIREFEPGAPIQGVGTSTVAFLGPCTDGPPNEPTKITNWDQFKKAFGQQPVSGHYLWYGVRGFFDNEGAVCYVVRVSNATYSSLALKDDNNKDTILVRARQLGLLASQIQVQVAQDDIAAGDLYRPEATVSSATGTTITVDTAAEAAQFRAGDKLTWTTVVGTPTVARVQDTKIYLTAAPATPPTNGTKIHLADLAVNDVVIRIGSGGEKLSAGSQITLKQAAITIPNLFVKQVTAEKISATETTYRVELRQGLAGPISFDFSNSIQVLAHVFQITVVQDGNTYPYEGLSMDPEHPRYFARVIRNDPDVPIFAEPTEPPNPNRPATPTALTSLSPGTADSPNTLTVGDYTAALATLEAVDDVNLIASPDRSASGDPVQTAILDHCQKMHDRFAILDSERSEQPFGAASLETHRNSLTTDKGFGALYYPWLLVMDSSGKENLLVPPSGHVAGIYARTDANRGVHKAPAGEEAIVRGCIGLEKALSNEEQGQLNLLGINVIRVFVPGGRPIVWGARTTASNSSWQYVNIRRLFLFLEESIQEGIRWAVFEPNNQQLWKKLKRTITGFLARVRRDGALFGNSDEEAFYVRIDDVLNPFDEQALGRLNIEIGIRPAYPAEFIIVQIGIWPGGSDVSES